MKGKPQDVDARNERSLNTLIRAISLGSASDPASGQFSLILARCNYASLRDRLIPQLRQRCPVPFWEITLPPSVTTLYTTIHTELEKHCGEQTAPDPQFPDWVISNAPPQSAADPTQESTGYPRAMLVFGLDSVRAIEPLITSTNQVREEFRKHVRFPLVLWVNDRVLQTLTRLAPDFKSWAATSIQFEMAVSSLITALQHHADLIFTRLLDAGSDQFLSNRAIAPEASATHHLEIEFALKDIVDSDQPLSPELQANLDFLLGRNAYSHGDLDIARECFERSLALWQQMSQGQTEDDEKSLTSLERQACLLFHLGMCWRTRSAVQRGEDDVACQQARNYFGQCLAVFTQAGRCDLVAKFINAQQEVLQKLGEWQDLKALSKRALALHRRYDDLVRQARDYGFLAEIALVNSDWLGAKQQAETALQCLAIAEEALTTQSDVAYLETSLDVARRYHLGWYLLLLAWAQKELGAMDDAIAYLEAAQDQSDPQYDPQLYIRILQALRSFYFSKKEYLKAFRLRRKQRSLEQQYGFRAFVGALQLQPQRQAISPELSQTDSQSLLAQEIAASGRQQDVNRLLTRISLPKDKLTVIHGPSGVGKSSIVNAGLVPALQRRVIGDRLALPVVLSVYTDWVATLERCLKTALDQSGVSDAEPTGSQSTRSALMVPPLAIGQSSAALHPLLEQLRQNSDRNLLTVLIFDQFEEFFFAYLDLQSRRPFYEFLQDCLNLPFVKVILTLREDYLHLLLECQRSTPLDIINHDILSKDIRYPLGDFSLEDARSVITSLTQRAQFYLEPALIEELVRDLAGELGAVRPIELQVVGARLQAENITTLEQYQQRGPKEKLVQRSLEEVIQDCGAENEETARLVLFLLTNENGTRPLKTRDELVADLLVAELALDLTTHTNKLDLVLEVLVDSGLVFLIPETTGDRYQLVHDYLVSFIRQQQASVLMEELQAVKELQKLTEGQLRQALKEKEDALQKEQQERQRAEVSEISALSTSSETLFALDRKFDALVEALKAGRLLTLLEHTDDGVRDRVIATLQQAVYWVRERNRLEGHNAPIHTVQFSPNGQWIVSASEDRTVKRWQIDGTLLSTLVGHQDKVYGVSISPDGQWIASASDDRTVRIWNQAGECVTCISQASSVTSVSFSPDGQTLVTGSQDHTINHWQLDGSLISTFIGHTAPIWYVCFSPQRTVGIPDPHSFITADRGQGLSSGAKFDAPHCTVVSG